MTRTRDKARAKLMRSRADRRKHRRGRVNQQAAQAFAAKHEIGCFKCKTREARWGSFGWKQLDNGRRHHWIICETCLATPEPEHTSGN